MVDFDKKLGIISDSLGRGADSPFKFLEHTGAVAVTSGVDKINNSIVMILTTRIGERFNNPEFGSRLPTRLFQPLDGVLKQTLAFDALQALDRWETRITDLEVGFVSTQEEEDRNLVKMAIEYKIKGTDITNIFVFPFSLSPQPGSN